MSAQPTDKERTVFTIEMLRVIADERERDLHAALRRRRLEAPPVERMRWHYQTARPRPKEARAL
jgi:hypothetical protein